MDKSWFRIILTWVVIIPDLILSYHALRNPFFSIEMTSLALNFVATTVLFYIYIDMGSGSVDYSEEDEEGGAPAPAESETSAQPQSGLYKLAFGSLIEDMLVWTGLFFILYNIVPVSLYVHNVIAKHI